LFFSDQKRKRQPAAIIDKSYHLNFIHFFKTVRIISGSAKGRKLCPPPSGNSTIRPTSDRAREALFSILGHRIQNVHVLDLFAGTGAFGLEALSRGAASSTFVDKGNLSINLIRKNCSKCFSGQAGIHIEIFQHDICQSLFFSSEKNNDFSRYGIIFLDPPYNKNIAHTILHKFDTTALLSHDLVLIAEEQKGVQLPDSPELTHLELLENRIYGESVFWLYSPSTSTTY
jgi:16S rRNA (guanine966-N2)-methyltransferase